jgi:outer membrane protein assembly factor BamB
MVTSTSIGEKGGYEGICRREVPEQGSSVMPYVERVISAPCDAFIRTGARAPRVSSEIMCQIMASRGVEKVLCGKNEDRYEIAWKFFVDDRTNSLVQYRVSEDGTIYVTREADSIISAVKEGKTLWEFNAGKEKLSPAGIGRDGRVYAGSCNGKLYCIKDGKKLWEFQTEGEITCAPVVGPDETVYTGSHDGNLYAIRDGKKLWGYHTGGFVVRPSLGPDGTLYFMDGFGLTAVKKGRKKWSMSISADNKPPVVGSDGILYLGIFPYAVAAVCDKKDHGKILWSHELVPNSPFHLSETVEADGTIYTSGYDCRLHAIRNGKELWNADIRNRAWCPPVIGKDGVVYAIADNVLTAVREGTVLFTFRADNDLYGARVDEQGTLYIKSSVNNGGPSMFHAMRHIREITTITQEDLQETAGDEKSEILEEDGFLLIGDLKLKTNKA